MKPRYGRREVDNSLEPGQDSFLDVVANLVGILIILVVLIGSQAKSVWEKLRTDEEIPNAEIVALESEIEKRDIETTRLKSENVQIESMIKAQKDAAKNLTRDREQLQLAIAAVKQSIDARNQELSKSEQAKFSLISQGERLKAELDSLASQNRSLEFNAAPPGVIDHLPTPIAKTVFGEEIHYRLKGGKLVLVPLDSLVELMRSEWKVKAAKLTQAQSTIETVGPIDNFRLQYKLVLKEQTQRTEYGVVRSMVPGLERFILLPTQEQMGESLTDALKSNSQFMQSINGLDPSEVTISVWVYPDSFGYFNELKRVLYDKGFLCAGWPLPEGQPISGSPNGFRTAAQ